MKSEDARKLQSHWIGPLLIEVDLDQQIILLLMPMQVINATSVPLIARDTRNRSGKLA